MSGAVGQTRVPLRRDGGFRRYWLARVISLLGSMVTYVVLPVLVYQVTASSLWTALVTVAEGAPYLCVGLRARAVADRGDRRRLMVGTDLASACAGRRVRRPDTVCVLRRGQVVAAQRNIKAAIALLDWLTAGDLTLATAGQGDLEAWLAGAQAAHRTDAGNFVRWARRHKLTRLDLAAVRWGGPSSVIDTETRWEQARWLVHDDTLKPEDRLAGLLVLLYAQRASTISRLTLNHVQANGHEVRLRLGREPVVLPEPLGTLAMQVAATRQGHAAIGDPGTSPWLFPGGQPGRPISAFRMAERLRQLGILSGQARSAALFQLATDLPAAVLARMLGIHIAVAVAWQRASAGDWVAYAADVARRTITEDQ